MNPRSHIENICEDTHRYPRFLLRRQGYSFTELILVVLILGVMAMISIPRLPFAAVRITRADSVARQMVTDLRRTRSLAIRDAATNTSGYRMSVTREQYSIRNLSTDEILETHVLPGSVTASGGTFSFGPLGNLVTGSDSTMTVTSDGHVFTLNLSAATGSVQWTESSL